jgi:hypothetical protein
MQSFLKFALVAILVSATDARRCKHRHSDHSTLTALPTDASSLTAVSPETPAAVLPSSSADAVPTTPSAPRVVTTVVDAPPSSKPAVEEPTSIATLSAIEPASSSPAVEASSAAVAPGARPASTPVINAPASADMCAENQKTLLDEWGLLVSNGRVVESTVGGTVCTTYNDLVTLADGQIAVKFTADANLAFDEATMNDNKFYSNMAVTKNVDEKLRDIASIPSSYSWSRTNTSDFRGKSSS